jgi:hypothetical protein
VVRTAKAGIYLPTGTLFALALDLHFYGDDRSAGSKNRYLFRSRQQSDGCALLGRTWCLGLVIITAVIAMKMGIQCR